MKPSKYIIQLSTQDREHFFETRNEKDLNKAIQQYKDLDTFHSIKVYTYEGTGYVLTTEETKRPIGF